MTLTANSKLHEVVQATTQSNLEKNHFIINLSKNAKTNFFLSFLIKTIKSCWNFY